ncbi:hypothetical protein FDK32_16370 [Citrobacter freundii]|uniref:hypothetical protein n=1 Tax=Citrobacter freundii TaxID=546 RepID=UPI001BAC88CA|nr:hypothetical protein [Citrobacter freundii]MBQ5149449.1 hypothetical protein [Citrobacter freundii]
MTTITREQLEQIIFFAGEATCHPDPNYWLEFEKLAPPGVVLELARIALASSHATPIYQVQYGQQWRDVTKERYEDHRDHGSPTRIVYATPQPVQDSEAQAAPAPINMSDDDIRALAEKHHAVIVCNGTGDYNDNYESVVKFGRALIAVLRPVSKFGVEETYHNMLKEEQEVNAKLAEYSLNKSQPQPTPESEDRKMLKRLAVIMSGNDAPGEIRSLTVTAQSLVDRCKTLAREKENSHIQWKPASPDEINKRSVREPTDTRIPSREAIIVDGVLVECPRCHGDAYRLHFNGWNYYRCDKCANAITSEGK